MCLVIFAWLVAQDYFKEMTDNDVRKRMYEDQKNQIDQDMAPFGFIDTGLEQDVEVDSEGSVWYVAEDGTGGRLDNYPSEYGDMNYMWEYR